MKQISTDRRCGAALLYVMLIFAAVSVIAAGLLARARLELDRTVHFVDATQAMQYAYGAEAYTRQQIYAAIKNNESGAIAYKWNNQPAFVIPEGVIEITIEDLRGRFNINSLVGGDQSAEDRFTALAASLNIDESTVENLFVRFREQQPQSDTAPADTSSPPSRGWLADPSELLDYGFPQAAYRVLAPYITALPSPSYAINLNAAPDEVLEAYLGQETQVEAARDLINANGFIDKERLGSLQIQDKSVGVTSDAFRVRVLVHLNGRDTRLSSILIGRQQQDRIDILTVARNWGY